MSDVDDVDGGDCRRVIVTPFDAAAAAGRLNDVEKALALVAVRRTAAIAASFVMVTDGIQIQ